MTAIKADFPQERSAESDSERETLWAGVPPGRTIGRKPAVFPVVGGKVGKVGEDVPPRGHERPVARSGRGEPYCITPPILGTAVGMIHYYGVKMLQHYRLLKDWRFALISGLMGIIVPAVIHLLPPPVSHSILLGDSVGLGDRRFDSLDSRAVPFSQIEIMGQRPSVAADDQVTGGIHARDSDC